MTAPTRTAPVRRRIRWDRAARPEDDKPSSLEHVVRITACAILAQTIAGFALLALFQL